LPIIRYTASLEIFFLTGYYSKALDVQNAACACRCGGYVKRKLIVDARVMNRLAAANNV
jgi:hypothetical protein